MPRHAVRVLMVDDEGDVLLVRFREGDRIWWCTPGGGIEGDENDEDAARREIREETGLSDFELGPVIWTRRHAVTVRGQAFDQRENIYLARVGRFVPQPGSPHAPEHTADDMRWWTVEELGSSTEMFAPRRLPLLVRELLRDGAPAVAWDVGV